MPALTLKRVVRCSNELHALCVLGGQGLPQSSSHGLGCRLFHRQWKAARRKPGLHFLVVPVCRIHRNGGLV